MRKVDLAECPFCKRLCSDDEILACGSAVAIWDRYPVTDGHALIVPRVHVPSVFDLPDLPQQELWEAVRKVRDLLVERYAPDGFTIGINDGMAAGQTVRHAHVHVIPRYEGDNPDPRGGIRWVIPTRAACWNDLGGEHG